MDRLSELILKPIFIHKYDKDKEARAREFYLMFQDESEEISKAFRHAQRDRDHLNYANSGVEKRSNDTSSTKKGNDLAASVEEAAQRLQRKATLAKERKSSTAPRSPAKVGLLNPDDDQ